MFNIKITKNIKIAWSVELQINEIFDRYKKIAVVGMSKSVDKAAHAVPAYMAKQGFTIYPVNPTTDEILKLKTYPNLLEVEGEIDIVNIFRPSQDCLQVVEEAVERKNKKGDIKVIWLQLGIVNNDAKMLAEEYGIVFVQDKCIYVEHKNWLQTK